MIKNVHCNLEIIVQYQVTKLYLYEAIKRPG